MNTPVNPAASRVAVLAEELFPLREFGRKAEDAVKLYGAAIVERALKDCHKAEASQGKRFQWPYVLGIAKRIEGDLVSPLPSASIRADRGEVNRPAASEIPKLKPSQDPNYQPLKMNAAYFNRPRPGRKVV